MKQLIQEIQKCTLFRDLAAEELHRILGEIKYREQRFAKGQVIAVEGQPCTALGIILQGTLEVQKVYASGKVVVMTHLQSGNIFGEAIIFSQNKAYPATIVATQDSWLIYIDTEDIIKLCTSNRLVLRHFMEHLTQKILVLNKKIRDLSFDTLRQKLAVYLLEEYSRQNSLELFLPMCKKDLADLLGVQRPSLSRELSNMEADGLIICDRRRIKILDIIALEDLAI